MFSLRNVMSAYQTPTPGRIASESNRFDGHQARMAGHRQRVRDHPCPCGSGQRFEECCLGKHQCQVCQQVFLIPDDGPPHCPACGSKQTTAIPLKEVADDNL